jgi:hypothetical protein
MDSDQPASTMLQTNAANPCQVKIETFYYPFWQAVDETGTLLATAKTADGLLLLTAPAGRHSIRLEFQARSVPRTMSMAVSIAALLLSLFALLGKLAWRKSNQAGLPLSNQAVSR